MRNEQTGKKSTQGRQSCAESKPKPSDSRSEPLRRCSVGNQNQEAVSKQRIAEPPEPVAREHSKEIICREREAQKDDLECGPNQKTDPHHQTRSPGVG